MCSVVACIVVHRHLPRLELRLDARLELGDLLVAALKKLAPVAHLSMV